MNVLNVLRIARMTVEENLRKRILFLLLFLTLLLVGGTRLINAFGLGVQARLVKDLSLFGVQLFAIFLTFALYLNLVPNEIEHKTIYPILAKPVRRREFLWGKFLGIAFLIFINLAVLALELIGIIYDLEHVLNTGVPKVVFLNFIECCILGAILIFFSLFLSTPINLSLTALIYIIGTISSTYATFLAGTRHSLFYKIIVQGFKAVIPQFDYLHIKNAVVFNYFIDTKYFLFTIFYGFMYAILVMLLSEMIFERKDL